MQVIRDIIWSIAEPTLIVGASIGLAIGGLYVHKPELLDKPLVPMVHDGIKVNPVKEMPNCHERAKRYFISAGELKEQDIDPNTIIMICGG